MTRQPLNEQELEVVRSCKEFGFGAYLQGAWFQYPGLIRKLDEGSYPSQKELSELNQRMEQRRISFDYHYLDHLLRMPVNPIPLEQQAWRLLSPNIKQHTKSFSEFLANYSPIVAHKDRILTYVSNWWNLLQDWNTISNSYKTKLEEMWDVLDSREEEVRELIKRLNKKR